MESYWRFADRKTSMLTLSGTSGTYERQKIAGFRHLACQRTCVGYSCTQVDILGTGAFAHAQGAILTRKYRDSDTGILSRLHLKRYYRSALITVANKGSPSVRSVKCTQRLVSESRMIHNYRDSDYQMNRVTTYTFHSRMIHDSTEP